MYPRYFLTKNTDKNVLSNFYKVTRPFGFWNMVKKDLSDEKREMINEENNRDIVAIFFAVPWQIVLFLTGMMIIFKQWSNFLLSFNLANNFINGFILVLV